MARLVSVFDTGGGPGLQRACYLATRFRRDHQLTGLNLHAAGIAARR